MEVTLVQFVGNLWAISQIAIVDYDKFNVSRDVKAQALFCGSNYMLMSDMYKGLYQKKVKNFGTINDLLVIEVQ